MTQTKDNAKRINEFNTIFIGLNDKGQEGALTVLRALRFAQSVMLPQDAENQSNPANQSI